MSIAKTVHNHNRPTILTGHRLALRVLSVGDCVADDILQKALQHATSLLIDQTRDTLHTSTTGQTTNSRLRDALDVVAKNLKQ